MPKKILIPSIDKRLGALLESARRNEAKTVSGQSLNRGKPAITVSREFGCETYPMVECLQQLLEKKTGETWTVMDKALLEEVAYNHNLSEELLKGLGEKSRFLDEILATFSPTWRTEKDHYRLLCRQILSLATSGNVIIVGRGSANITQSMKNCYHFRMFASMDFKIRSIARRLDLPGEEAERVISKRQQQRDRFIKDFLNQDAADPSFYHLIFNNDKNRSEKIATTIMEYVLTE